MKKLFSPLILLLVLAAGAYVAMPFVTLWQIKSAADAQDSARLSRHVDFPVLRANLRKQLRGPTGDWIYKQDKSELEGAFASFVGGFMVDSLVDAMVSPQGLDSLMNGQTRVDQIKGKTSAGGGSSSKKEAQKSFRFASPSEFHLVLTPVNKPPISIVLTRKGLEWKLSNILLPRSEG